MDVSSLMLQLRRRLLPQHLQRGLRRPPLHLVEVVLPLPVLTDWPFLQPLLDSEPRSDGRSVSPGRLRRAHGKPPDRVLEACYTIPPLLRAHHGNHVPLCVCLLPSLTEHRQRQPPQVHWGRFHSSQVQVRLPSAGWQQAQQDIDEITVDSMGGSV